MKEIIEIAKKIKDKDLQKKTIEMLNDPKISNKSIKYPAAKFDKIPCWIGAHHFYEGGLLKHTESVTKIAMNLAEHLSKTYSKIKINMDHIIAGALLHDIAKVFMIKPKGKTWEFTGATLDHADFSAAELYARGFPEEVVHIVAAHGGDACTPRPKTIEASLVYYADIIDSMVDANANELPSSISPLQLMQLLGGEQDE